MKICILFFATVLAAQVWPGASTLPADTTKEYAISTAERLNLNNQKASAEIALRKHDHEAFSKAHHAWWDACQVARVDNKLPATAVCDYERNIIRGRDAR